ncbi:MAG: preprotein translocase subunit Tim44 [Planctomycetes bacterium RBG_16_55_9]|nr:MAG: preprotein translocase subunit Tim44 [Planctomycetes bacterium RBG_16_55_9]
MTKKLSIGQYLLNQLYRHGVRHIFGVPGDYILGLYSLIENSPIQLIGTTREDSAGLAADAYARLRGMGVACVTFCVGGLNVTNPVAGAYAEKSPVIVISGAPGLRGRQRHPLVHHLVRDFATQREIFSRITVASASLEDPYTAYNDIDQVIHAVERYKRPGYIELPADMVNVARSHQHRDQSLAELTDAAALQECIAEATRMLNQSRRPVILAGVEVHRFGLQDALIELVEKTRIPVAATILGKSVVSEAHPLYLGVYEGAMGRADVQKYVESADCVLMLGCFMTDINLGVYTAYLDANRTIYATSEKLSIRRHSFENVPFRSFFGSLLEARLKRRRKPEIPKPELTADTNPRDDDRITTRILFSILNDFISDNMVVISDIGDCLFGAVDLKIHKRTEFLSPAYYTSMGFGVPASLGAQLADRSLRPLVLVGDGAFQMTGLELSTIVRLGLNPVVVVLNNHGYSTERQIMEGPFNDILNWNFSKVPNVLGSGLGFIAHTAGDVRRALEKSLANRDSFSIIEVDLDPYDISPALIRLGRRLGKQAKG